MSIKVYSYSDTIQLSENFNAREFRCKCGKIHNFKVDDKLVKYLQKIRDHFGKPVTINSAFRCITHDKNVGGTGKGNHTKGIAADIVVQGVEPSEVAKYAESIGIFGIGLYETNADGFFVHIDTRIRKSFWYGQKQQYRSTFGGSPAVAVSNIKEWQNSALKDGFSLPSGADGKFGAECLNVAKKAICKRNTTGYTNNNLVRIIQKAVGVTADGKFGKNTEAAVKEFQKKNGLTVDGVVGVNTWKKILNI